MTDEELVSLYVTTQHNHYFERLYERYSDKVYRKCLSFTRDPFKAEDYTHDIFLRLMIRLDTFREQSRFATWLFSVTHNYCTDQVRTSRRRVELLAEEPIDWLVGVDDCEMQERADEQLQSAFENLTADEQMILTMKYTKGETIREIARLCGIAESTVKMRLKRAKSKLRKNYIATILVGILFQPTFCPSMSLSWNSKTTQPLVKYGKISLIYSRTPLADIDLDPINQELLARLGWGCSGLA